MVIAKGVHGKGWVCFAKTLRDFYRLPSPVMVNGNRGVALPIGGTVDGRGKQSQVLRPSYDPVVSYRAALVKPMSYWLCKEILVVMEVRAWVVCQLLVLVLGYQPL